MESRITAAGFVLGLLLAGAATACGEADAVRSQESPIYVCGNGTVETGEECDDGNRVQNDGCTATCKLSKVDIDVSVNTCPIIQAFVVSPSQVPAGHEASAHVQATDANDDPLTYAWSATSGTFSAPDKADTQYACDDEGSQLLTIVVDDGRRCTDEVNLPILCLPAE